MEHGIADALNKMHNPVRRHRRLRLLGCLTAHSLHDRRRLRSEIVR